MAYRFFVIFASLVSSFSSAFSLADEPVAAQEDERRLSPQAEGNVARSPAIDGPATDAPVGENAYLYTPQALGIAATAANHL